MEFNEIFRNLTEGQGVMADMARVTGISDSALSKYRENTSPSLTNAVLIARYFNISLDYLAGLSDDPTPRTLGDPDAISVMRSYDMMGNSGRSMLAGVARSLARDPANRVKKERPQCPRNRIEKAS